MKEQWKTYKHPYRVSNMGNVQNVETGNYLYGGVQNNGYILMNLRSIKEHILLHRMVAFTFIDNDDILNKTQVNHIDAVKTNNKASNLEWVTQLENIRHSHRMKLPKHPSKKVYCFTLDGKFVAEYVNATTAMQSSGRKGSLSGVIKSNKIHNGLWWTYSPVFDRKKAIYVYDKGNNFIGSYYSQKECSDDLGISTSHLSQVVNGFKNSSQYNIVKSSEDIVQTDFSEKC